MIKLKYKIFAALFFCTAVFTLASTYGVWRVYQKSATDDFIENYRNLNQVIGNTITLMESNAERTMYNAAVALRATNVDSRTSIQKVKVLAADLSMTHVFVVGKNGTFLSSTNEDPREIPNLYSFCSEYKNLVNGTEEFFATPIIPPQPEPSPYKFLMLSTKDGKEIIEVGLQADFLGKTLVRALSDDSNLAEIDLYTPTGISLGGISRHVKPYKKHQIDTSSIKLNEPIFQNGKMIVFSEVSSTQPRCCQCTKSGLTKAGKYFYILRTVVSTKGLDARTASSTKYFFQITGAVLISCVLIGWILAKSLMQRLNQIANEIEDITVSGDLTMRLSQSSVGDETRILTARFNELLDTVEKNSELKEELQREKIASRMAQQVSHDIKSPLSALKIVLGSIRDRHSEASAIGIEACVRIENIADDLKKNDSGAQYISSKNITDAIREVVQEKEIRRQDLHLSISDHLGADFQFGALDETTFKRMLSNLLENSIEACLISPLVHIATWADGRHVYLTVADNGHGFTPFIIEQLGSAPVSTKDKGRGLGLYSALNILKARGGLLVASNNIGAGATIKIQVPIASNFTVSDIQLKQEAPIVVEQR